MRNEKQILAIEHFTGPCLVVAGPGSGKTKCLVERVYHLIDVHHISPDKILVLTFTKDAAKEMKDRFLKQSSCVTKIPFFGTFHSFFYTILKEEYHFTNENIITSKSAYSLLMKSLTEHGIKASSLDVYGVLKEISSCTNQNISPKEYESRLLEHRFERVYATYQKKKEENHFIDFDDMQTLVYKLFSSNKSVLKKWQDRYSFVLLDEMQDINELQFFVTKLLCEEHNNLFAVGDDDQSIYEFRGAKTKLFLSLKTQDPDLKTIVLDTNYRCKKNIVSVSSNFIKHNKNRIDKEYHSFSEAPGIVKTILFEDEKAQANGILNIIKKHPNETVGILFRNKRDGDYISRFLEWNHILYYSKERFYSNTTNEILADVTLFFGKYFELSDSKEESDFFLKEIKYSFQPKSYYSLMNYFRKGAGYDSYIKQKYKDDELILDVCFSYLDEIQKECKKFSNECDPKSVIDELKTLEIKEKYRLQVKEDAKIFLYTYHGSKGLEFDITFCINVNEGMVPSPFHKGDLEEERRMFYVALTRARFQLYVCSIKIRGGKFFPPSVFISEMKD